MLLSEKQKRELGRTKAPLKKSMQSDRRKVLLSGFTPLEMQSKSNDSLRKRQRRFLSLTGFTLIELLLALFIAMLVFGALLSVVNYTFDLQETSRNRVIAINAARERIEEIRNTSDFDSIVGSYNNTTFSPQGFTAGSASGRISANYVSGSGNNLIDIRVAVCWRQKNARIIGEDNGQGSGVALDGILNGSEDVNNNGLIDSPCVLTTAVRRTS